MANDNDPLTQLADALKVDPSPEFTAEVRRHVAEDAARRTMRGRWLWPALAAAAAIAVMATGWTMWRAPLAVPARISELAAASPAPAAVPAPVNVASDAAPVRPIAKHSEAPASRGSTTTPSPRDHDVIIAPDEMRGVRELLAAIHESGFVPPDSGPPVSEAIVTEKIDVPKPLPPERIEIPSIVFEQPEIPTFAGEERNEP